MMVGAQQARACVLTPNSVSDMGVFSPAAVQQAKVPALSNNAGLMCSSAILTLLGGNYIRATFHSDNGFKLFSADGASVIPYAASADAAGTVPFAQDGTIDYMQNNLLNLLGLLGNSNAALPFFVKPAGGILPPPGIYRDRVSILWTWNICPGIGALGLCIGIPDTGTGTTIIDVVLNVTPKKLLVSTSVKTMWDPVAGTNNPKSIPKSRQRVTYTVSNPDIVAADANSLAIVVPVDGAKVIALDGDGTSANSFLFADGSPSSTLAFSYVASGSASDDVDFSSDFGATWNYAPIAGDAVSQGAVTTLRIHPRGAMAPGSSFTISAPFSVR